jgi:hypothetical protein
MMDEVQKNNFTLKSYPHVSQLQCWEFQEINFCSNLFQSFIVQTVYIDLGTEGRAYANLALPRPGMSSQQEICKG